MLTKSKRLRKARQWLMNASPGLYIALSKFVSRHVLFRAERAFLAGGLDGGGGGPSFGFFGASRAGSMLLTRTLAALAGENGRIHIDLERYFLHTDRRQQEHFEDADWVRKHFGKPGFFFGALRRTLPGPAGRALPGVAVVRDPRDIVVSEYYSITAAHTVFDRTFLAMKERAASMTIDEFALDFAPKVIAEVVSLWRLGNGNAVIAMRYEDIREQGSKALQQIAEAVGLAPPSAALRSRFDEDIRPRGSGDPSAHKRSGAHGQFLKELQPETIDEFERRYGAEIRELGYDLTGPETLAGGGRE